MGFLFDSSFLTRAHRRDCCEQEAAARADLAAAALSQQLECTRLQSKLEGLREGHRLRADVEAELLTRQEAARAAQAALQQAKEKAERDHQKQMIAAFKCAPWCSNVHVSLRIPRPLGQYQTEASLCFCNVSFNRHAL